MSLPRNVIALSRNVPESASGTIPLDAIESPILKHGLDYWLALKGARSYPARNDMKPRDLTPVLRNLVLIRLIEGGADYEYRIVGDAHVISHGYTMQGLKVSDVDRFSPGYSAVLKGLFDRAVRKRDVFAFRGWMESGDKAKPFIYSESLFMPMGPDEATIDHVLNFAVYTPRDRYDA